MSYKQTYTYTNNMCKNLPKLTKISVIHFCVYSEEKNSMFLECSQKITTSQLFETGTWLWW